MHCPDPGSGDTEQGEEDVVAMKLNQVDDCRICAWIQNECSDFFFFTLKSSHHWGEKEGVGTEELLNVDEFLGKGMLEGRALAAEDVGNITWCHVAPWESAGTGFLRPVASEPAGAISPTDHFGLDSCSSYRGR